MENTTNEQQNYVVKAKKGFASLSPERRRLIAGAGGTAAHKKGTAHRFDSEKAREAGRKGGNKVSQNKEHMAAIGQKGGAKRSQNAGLNKYDKLIEASRQASQAE